MKEKEKIKLNVTLIVICVCVLSFSLLWVSYGYFFKLDNDVEDSLLVEYLDKNGNTLSTHNVPMTFDLNSVKNSEVIYVQNSDTKHSKKIAFTVEKDVDSFQSRSDYKSTDTLIPLEYINAMVYKFDERSNKLNPVTDIVNLGNATIYNSNGEEVEYSLYVENLGSASSLNNANTYTIFMWLDSNAPEEYYDAYLSIRIEVREIT